MVKKHIINQRYDKLVDIFLELIDSPEGLTAEAEIITLVFYKGNQLLMCMVVITYSLHQSETNKSPTLMLLSMHLT